jgi:predicted dehydrogenase
MKYVALVGYGYWGTNLLRNFVETKNCEVVYVCDNDITRLKPIRKRYPSIILTSNYEEILVDKEIDAVIIATPTRFHHSLAKKAMEAGKDVLIEKPMALSVSEAKDLVMVSKKTKRIIMVDHTFLFTPAVRKLKKIIDSGEIGDIVYIDSVRINLGLFQTDSNVSFDLATHDIAILQYLLNVSPTIITSVAKSFYGTQEEIFYIHLNYPNKITCHLHVSWLSPLKVRKMMIVGTKKMIVYDDVEQSEKIKIYDKGVVFEQIKTETKKAEQIRIGYRSGDVNSPNIDIKEALGTMALEFMDALETRKEPVSNGLFGLSIVNILEMSNNSSRSSKTIIIRNKNDNKK